MTIDIQAFQPVSSYTISATASSTNTALTQPTNPNPSGAATGQFGYTRLKCYNASSTNACYLNPTSGSTVATATSPFIVPPATWVTFEMGGPYTNLAVITSASTATLYVMLGGGF